MKILGAKLLGGGVAATSVTGLGVYGVSSFNKKDEIPKTATGNEISKETLNKKEEESDSVSPKPEELKTDVSCKVFEISNKGTGSEKFNEIVRWQEERKKEEQENKNKKFWEDVERSCSSNNKKVYVTKNGDVRNWSAADQREWRNHNL